MRQNRHNQIVYQNKNFKLITDTTQLFNMLKKYKLISIVDHKTVIKNYNKYKNFPTILLSKIFNIEVINDFLLIFSENTGFVLQRNFLVTELTKNNIIIICKDYIEKIDQRI